MIRIAIIDHTNHELFIEDVDDETLKKYNSEEDYINDNYDLEEYSWDYITDAVYLPNAVSYDYDPITINFKKILNH